ncbi:MAG: dihydrofolate reductase [Candidatus Levyibacteriota bacterium]
MKISMIAAIGENRELGKDNKLLFQIPEDMKMFREVTRGHPVIMGRKTAEHLVQFYTKGPLPGRLNIVITRDRTFELDGFTIVHSMEDAIEEAEEFENEEIFIIGGGETYTLGLPYADRLYLTVVQGKYDADAFFPDYSSFKTVISEKKSSGEGYNYTFKILEKA